MPPTNPDPCPIILLDGGLGTTLSAPPHNCTFSSTKTPLWSSHLLISPSDREILLKAQSDFVRAGADVLLTATYQASFEGFAATPSYGSGREGRREMERGWEERQRKEVEGLMRGAVGIAEEALVKGRSGEGEEGKGKGGKVALSLGAYGAVMIPSAEYSGLYDEGHRTVEELRDWHLERLGVFLPPKEIENEKGGEREERKKCWDQVSMIAFETLPLLNEVKAVREAVFRSREGREKSEWREFWISCVFPGEENKLPDGSTVREVVDAMVGEKEGASRPMGIGLNCTKVSKVESLVLEFESAVREMGEQGRVGLVVYPDGTKVGERYNTVTQEWEVDGEAKGEEGRKAWDEEIFEIVVRARERGVWNGIYVGGCCRTGPEEIARLRRRIDGV